MVRVSKPWADAALSMTVDLTTVPAHEAGNALAAACRLGGESIRYVKGVVAEIVPRALVALHTCPNLCRVDGIVFSDAHLALLLFATCPALAAISNASIDAYCYRDQWADTVTVATVAAARSVLGAANTNHVRVCFTCDVTSDDVGAVCAVIDGHAAPYGDAQPIHDLAPYGASTDVVSLLCRRHFDFPNVIQLGQLQTLRLEDYGGNAPGGLTNGDIYYLAGAIATSSLRVFSLVLNGDDDSSTRSSYHVNIIDACRLAPHMQDVTLVNAACNEPPERNLAKWAALGRLIRRGPPLRAVKAEWHAYDDEEDADSSIEAIRALEAARGLDRVAIHASSVGGQCIAWMQNAMRERRLTNANVKHFECTDGWEVGHAETALPALSEAAINVSIVLTG